MLAPAANQAVHLWLRCIASSLRLESWDSAALTLAEEWVICKPTVQPDPSGLMTRDIPAGDNLIGNNNLKISRESIVKCCSRSILPGTHHKTHYPGKVNCLCVCAPCVCVCDCLSVLGRAVFYLDRNSFGSFVSARHEKPYVNTSVLLLSLRINLDSIRLNAVVTTTSKGKGASLQQVFVCGSRTDVCPSSLQSDRIRSYNTSRSGRPKGMAQNGMTKERQMFVND